MIFVIGVVLVVGLLLAVNYSLIRRGEKESARIQAALYQGLDLTPPPEQETTAE